MKREGLVQCSGACFRVTDAIGAKTPIWRVNDRKVHEKLQFNQLLANSGTPSETVSKKVLQFWGRQQLKFNLTGYLNEEFIRKAK